MELVAAFLDRDLGVHLRLKLTDQERQALSVMNEDGEPHIRGVIVCGNPPTPVPLAALARPAGVLFPVSGAAAAALMEELHSILTLVADDIAVAHHRSS